MEPGENNVKVCPFLGTDCVQEKCALWVQVFLTQPSPLGVVQAKPTQMCVFVAQLLIAGSPKPSPLPVQRLLLGDLKGGVGQG